MTSKWITLIILSLVIVGCNTDEIPEPEIPGWKKFEGTYNVTKLENGQTYHMEIAFDSLVHQPSGETHLYIMYRNFDNSFDSLVNGYSSGIPDDRLEIQPFGIQHSVEDHNGSHWALSMLADDPNTPELENTLVNDTILFYFQKSNIAFYFEDGVPFYECECKHLAVKIE